MLLVFLTYFLFPCHQQAEQINISNCYIKDLQKNEFYITSQDNIFLESIDLNFSNPQLQHKMIIETQIIQNYSNQDVVILLPTFIINDVDNNQNFISQFCWLSKNTTTYYITCKKRMHNYLVDNQIIFGSEVTSQIKTPSQENYTCENLFINEQQMVNIFCFSISNIHIISLNLDRNITQYTYNNTQSINFNSCYRQVLNTVYEDQFIIAFTKCKYWSVLLYKGFSIQNIININNLTNHDNISENDELTNIQLCQNNLYLIFKNYYQVIDIEVMSIKFIYVSQEQNQILSLLFSTTCSIYSYVLISETTSNQITVINNLIYLSISQIPQDIYYWKNLLILQYSSQISLMMNQRIIQNYELKLSTLKYDKTYNLFYGYDYIQNSIKAFKLQFQFGYFQYNIYNYFLEVQAKNLLLKEDYVIMNCYQIYQQDNTQFYGYILKENIDFGVTCLHENYISFKFSTLFIESNRPIIYQVDPNSKIVDISDRQEWELICQPNIKGYNSKDSPYLLTYQNKGLLSQQYVWKNDQKYILQSCKGEELQQSLVYNSEQTEVFYYIGTVVLVLLEFQEVRIHDFSKSVNTYQIIKLPGKIFQINQFKEQIIFQLEDNNHIFVINLSQLLNFFYKYEKQLKESKVLFFRQINQNLMIQYEKHLYIKFQETNSVFQFQDHLIIYSLFEKSLIVFYAIDQFQNKIIKYLYRDQQLIFQEQLNLNQYQFQIYIPLKMQCNYGKIIIATKNQFEDLFLLIINTQNIISHSLEQIIEIGRLEFFSTAQFLYFYDKDIKIQIYQFNYLNFMVDIQSVDYYQNIVAFNESLVCYSQVQPFNKLNVYVTFQFSNLCYTIKKLDTSSKILHIVSKSTIQLNIREYFSGPIKKLKLLNASNLELHGPYLQRQKLYLCNNHSDQTPCLQTRTIQYQGNDTLQIQFVQFQFESKILKIVNNDNHLFHTISISQIYLLEDDNLLIIKHQQDTCVFLFYEFNLLNQIYFEKSVINYECSYFQITKCKKQGNILMLKFEEQARFFLIFEQYVTELHFQIQYQFDDFFIIKNISNIFVFLKNHQDFSFCLMSVYYLDQNQLYFNSSYKLDKQKFLNVLLQNELESQIIYLETPIFYKSFKIEQQQIISKILITSKRTMFIGSVKCSIQEKECIFSITEIFKITDHLTNERQLQFKEDFIQILINHNYYLYDLKLKNSLNYIASSFQLDYEIFTFNTTHYLFNPINQSGDIYVGQIGYEISLLEIGKKQKEIQFNLLAQNELSEEQVVLTFFKDDLNLQTQIITKYLICSLTIIFIILLIYLIRRSKLKLQNKLQRINNKQ